MKQKNWNAWQQNQFGFFSSNKEKYLSEKWGKFLIFSPFLNDDNDDDDKRMKDECFSVGKGAYPIIKTPQQPSSSIVSKELSKY